MNKRLFVALILVVILGPFCAAAITIEGTVYYSTYPMSDVLVKLCLKSSSNCVASMFSDASGHYEFLDVAPGSYDIPYRKVGDDTFHAKTLLGAFIDSDVVIDLHMEKIMTINGYGYLSEVAIHEQRPEFCWTNLPEAVNFQFLVWLRSDGSLIESASNLTDHCYRLQDRLVPGSYSIIVTAQDSIDKCSTIGSGFIFITLNAEPRIEVTPSSHNFGRIPARQCSALPKEFILSNTGSGNLNVSAISLSNTKNFDLLLDGGPNPCNVSNPTISPGGSCTVAVTFCPSSKGNKFADLTVTSNDPDTSTLTVELSGTTLDHGWKWIITIDGMDFWSTYIPGWPDMPTIYLYEAISTDWRNKILQKAGLIRPFSWSRDLDDTRTAVEDLYKLLKEKNNTGKPIVILAHSWGTVLAYLTLMSHSDIHVDKLITLGSPLDATYPAVAFVTQGWLEDFGISSVVEPTNLNEWHNYWAACDLISETISALPNKNNYRNRKLYWTTSACHSSYFEDPSKWNKILKDVIKK